jgi:hypothetical protein
VTQEIRELIDRILSSYDEIDARFTSAGGLGSILSLYEQVRRELERVSFQELDRMTGEIKNVIEALLTIDYELRKVQNLKLVFESRRRDQGGARSRIAHGRRMGVAPLPWPGSCARDATTRNH